MAEFTVKNSSSAAGAGDSCGLFRLIRPDTKSKALRGALGGTRTPNPFLRTELLFH